MAGERRPVGAGGSLHSGFQSSMTTAVLRDGGKEEENSATLPSLKKGIVYPRVCLTAEMK